MKKSLVLIVSLMLFGATAWAGQEAANADKPSMFVSETFTVTAQVTAINHETREVTLLASDGSSQSLVIGEEARNLDQVSVGDIITTEFVESISIEVFAGDGTAPGAGEILLEERTEKGEMPGGAIVDAVVIQAKVVAIDLEAMTYKLEFPSGEVKQYKALYPENLKKAAVGDNVVITITEAVAISVAKSAAE